MFLVTLTELQQKCLANVKKQSVPIIFQIYYAQKRLQILGLTASNLQTFFSTPCFPASWTWKTSNSHMEKFSALQIWKIIGTKYYSSLVEWFRYFIRPSDERKIKRNPKNIHQKLLSMLYLHVLPLEQQITKKRLIFIFLSKNKKKLSYFSWFTEE